MDIFKNLKITHKIGCSNLLGLKVRARNFFENFLKNLYQVTNKKYKGVSKGTKEKVSACLLVACCLLTLD